jgi:hypothetical protein
MDINRVPARASVDIMETSAIRVDAEEPLTKPWSDVDITIVARHRRDPICEL